MPCLPKGVLRIEGEEERSPSRIYSTINMCQILLILLEDTGKLGCIFGSAHSLIPEYT